MAEESQWYFRTDAREVGPISWDEIRHRAQSGEIGLDDQVWTVGGAHTPAASVRGLFRAERTLPPPNGFTEPSESPRLFWVWWGSGEPWGPFPPDKVLARVTPYWRSKSLACPEGESEWQPFDAFPELATLTQSAVPHDGPTLRERLSTFNRQGTKAGVVGALIAFVPYYLHRRGFYAGAGWDFSHLNEQASNGIVGGLFAFAILGGIIGVAAGVLTRRQPFPLRHVRIMLWSLGALAGGWLVIAGDSNLREARELRDSLRQSGISALDRGDFHVAASAFHTALSIAPSAELYYLRGQAFLGAKDAERAIADFSDAVRLKPDYAYAYRGRAKAHESKGDVAASKLDLEFADQLDPGGKRKP